MNPLIDSLLDETPLPEVSPNNRPAITEAAVKLKIKEGAGQPITLSAQESKILQDILRLAENDPFRHNLSFDSGDLEGLGLKIRDGEDNVRELPHPGDRQFQEPNFGDLPDGMINIDQAVVAPNATPGHDEPIPDSVLYAMDTINGVDQEKPVPASFYSDRGPSGATSRGNVQLGDENQEEPPPVPGEPEAGDTVDDVAAKMVDSGEDDFGESLAIGSANEVGLDPRRLQESMRKMRRAKAGIESAPRRRRASLEEIASANRSGGASAETGAELSRKISLL